MSNISTLPTRAFVSLQCRIACRGQEGQATAEFGVVILVAIALALAVFKLFQSGTFDAVLTTLMKTVLGSATKLAKAG